MSTKIHTLQWEQKVTRWVSGEMTGDAGKAMTEHIASCTECARLARDLQSVTSVLASLPVRETSPMFDAKLAGRIAVLEEARRGQSWWQTLSHQWRRAARPALAAGACAVALVGVAALERPSVPVTISNANVQSVSDKTLMLHCVEQQRTDDSAQPLSDPAAQNLASKMDDTSAQVGSATLPSEDGL